MRGIYLDRDTLLSELTSDVKAHQKIADLLPITVYSRSDNSSNDHLRFLFYQLFLDEYCLNSSTYSTSNLLAITEEYYRSNSHQLDEFNHSMKNVLKSFLRESFLRRLLTKSLLILNLKILFALRFFIKDMHKVMLDSPKTFQLSEEQIFYRSQILSAETFGRIKSNIGKK